MVEANIHYANREGQHETRADMPIMMKAKGRFADETMYLRLSGIAKRLSGMWMADAKPILRAVSAPSFIKTFIPAQYRGWGLIPVFHTRPPSS